MVSLTGVSKDYQGQSKVLDQIQLELRKGDFIYVVGARAPASPRC
jgi:ABC-type ATPase involved in cell division